DGGGVGVVDDVVAELASVLQDVVHDPTEESDVGTGPNRDVKVGHGAGAGEPGVDVDDRGAPFLGGQDPLEPDRVALGRVRALDDDAVGVLQVLLERGGPAPPERCPQTGDGGGVSYPG